MGDTRSTVGDPVANVLSFTVEDFLRVPFDPIKPIRKRVKSKEQGKVSEAEEAQRRVTEEQSKVTSEAGRKERERRLRALGRSGTIITGGRGLTEKATVTRKTLLGE